MKKTLFINLLISLVLVSFASAITVTTPSSVIPLETNCDDVLGGMAMGISSGALASVDGVHNISLYSDAGNTDSCYSSNNNIGGEINMSLSFWVNFTTFTDNKRIMSWVDPGVEMGFSTFDTGMIRYRTALGVQWLVGNGSIVNDKWYNIILTYSKDDGIALYINCVLNMTAPNKAGEAFATTTSDDMTLFNRDSSDTYGIDGTLDEVYTWVGYTLTSAEVAILCDRDNPEAFYPFSLPPTDVAPDPPAFVDPTPANATRINANGTINMTCDDELNYYLWFEETNPPNGIALLNTTEGNWSMNVSIETAYFYRGACLNITSSLFSVNTTLRNFTLDLTTPTITINPNNFFNATTNQSTIDQYSDVLLPINISFADQDGDLFGFLLNITLDGVIAFNTTNTSLFGTSYNYTESLNTSTWDAGVYDINIEVADRHTLSIIGGYDISKFGNRITFRTIERNTIKISSIGAYTTTYQKSRDRYAFGFKYIFSGESRTFTLESDNKIYYLPDSKYNAHFVILGDKLKGNWIDFEGIGKSYDVEKISDYEYKIMFNNLEKSNEVILNSIGGLNTRIENYQWYKGTATTTFTASATTESLQEFTLNVTTQNGFVEDVNATFKYNNSFRAITTTTANNFIFFSSQFNVPTPENTYNLTWNITVTQNDSTLYDFNISDSQNVLLAQINITFLDEQNQTMIRENVTVFLTLEQTTQDSSDAGFLLIGNLTLGDYFILGESNSYPRRGMFVSITNQTQKINLYLLKDAIGNDFTDYFIFSTSQNRINDVKMTFDKTINGSFVTVAQEETDFAGQVRLFQDEQTEYRITLEHDNFVTKIITLRPLLSEYTIFLDEFLPSLYTNVMEGIRYTLFPKERIHNVSLTPLPVGIDIFSDDSSLEYFGVFIDDHNFTCVPASCVSNITGIPAGGTAQVTILGNFTGTFDVHYFFKKSGFELQYIHGDLYGFIIIAELFGENIANWLDLLAEGLGGRTASRPMLSILAAVLTTVLVVIASQLGIIGIPLVLVAVFGNLFFLLAGFIPAFVGVVSTIVGLAVYFILGRDE